MSAIQKGASVAFGHGGNTQALLKLNSGNDIYVFLQDMRVNVSSSTQEIIDGNGECTGKVFFDQRDTLTTSLFVGANPGGGNTAEANFNLDIKPGDVLYLGSVWDEANSTNAATELSAAYTNGQYNWVIDSAEKVRTTSGISEWSITAVSYATDLTA